MEKQLIKNVYWQGEMVFLFMTIVKASGHSRRPSGRSPCSALFIAGSLEHHSFEQVIICACIIASTSLPSLERESLSHTTRATPFPPLFGSFVREYFNTPYTSGDVYNTVFTSRVGKKGFVLLFYNI